MHAEELGHSYDNPGGRPGIDVSLHTVDLPLDLDVIIVAIDAKEGELHMLLLPDSSMELRQRGVWDDQFPCNSTCPTCKKMAQ